MDKISIKALGQTIEQEGKVALVSYSLPANCMVLFVSLDIWREIKDMVIYEKEEER